MLTIVTPLLLHRYILLVYNYEGLVRKIVMLVTLTERKLAYEIKQLVESLRVRKGDVEVIRHISHRLGEQIVEVDVFGI